jgi:hypothetical protein
MSVALPLNPRIAAVLSAARVLGCPIYNFIAKRARICRDARTLQMLPDSVLADMGLEKLHVLTGTIGNFDIRVIRHRNS